MDCAIARPDLAVDRREQRREQVAQLVRGRGADGDSLMLQVRTENVRAFERCSELLEFCSPIPASGSIPSASHGVGDAIDAVAMQRPARRAPSASVCGPPPEPPSDANRSMPSSSATSSMSFAMSTTLRPGFGVEPP